MKRQVLLVMILTLLLPSFTYGLGLKVDHSPSAFLKAGYEWGWNSFDHWDNTGALRVDLGFFM